MTWYRRVLTQAPATILSFSKNTPHQFSALKSNKLVCARSDLCWRFYFPFHFEWMKCCESCLMCHSKKLKLQFGKYQNMFSESLRMRDCSSSVNSRVSITGRHSGKYISDCTHQKCIRRTHKCQKQKTTFQSTHCTIVCEHKNKRFWRQLLCVSDAFAYGISYYWIWQLQSSCRPAFKNMPTQRWLAQFVFFFSTFAHFDCCESSMSLATIHEK